MNKSPLLKVIRDQLNLLFFRSFKPSLDKHAHVYIAWGLATTWLVGMGRYWDHPNAEAWQYLGLGSVAYVFVLAAIIWLIVLPLEPSNWSYRNVLIFVTLTSLPALLYAIPVERFMSLQGAKIANFWFLAIVAIWRVALLLVFLRRAAKLSRVAAVTACLLPLALIVTVLSGLNLEHAVFQFMGSMRNETSNDAAYLVVVLLSVLSVFASPVLLFAYLVIVGITRKRART